MILGVDIGTQSLKAVVLDSDLAVKGEAAIPYQPSFPAPGWAEQDPALPSRPGRNRGRRP
jgi:xylulokinase